MLSSASLSIALGAVLVEAAFGYPAWLLRRIGHPVMWAGAAIAWLDRTLNRNPRTLSPSRWRERVGVRMASPVGERSPEDVAFDGRPPSPSLQRHSTCSAGGTLRRFRPLPPAGEGFDGRVRGIVALVALVALVGIPAWSIQAVALRWLPRPGGLVLLALAASTLLAQRSLGQHVGAVAAGLDRGLPEARAAVSHIVGRDPDSLDAAGVARAAIESLAENFSDGVVAPALWCALFGLPGIAIYKAVNTADSMIGHRTPRYLQFGWAAARLVDLVNLPASRLAALLLAVASGRAMRLAALAVWRDAGRHRSPNAGWPEAAMAGALGLRLAGPRVYGALRVEDGWMGDGRAEAGPADIRRALTLYRRACMIGPVLPLAVFALRAIVRS